MHPLPDSHNFLELYESKTIISNSHQPPTDFVFESVWQVNGDDMLDAFATYIVYGDTVEGPYSTSNQDGDVTYTCWATVLIPLPLATSSVRCFQGDTLVFTSTCSLLVEDEPSYRFAVTLKDTGGAVQLEKNVAVDYKDLLCTMVPLRDVLKRWEQNKTDISTGRSKG